MKILELVKRLIFSILLIAFVICGFYACASIGTPLGGDADLTPPRFLGSKPAPYTTNFEGNKIELIFDEYITLEKPAEKVIITPPQKKNPVINALGKKISVELKDSLVKDVTYTFDFTDAIVDNNEKNALEGFTFAFSTGNVIDTLVVSGILLNAENLEPMKGVMVGLHSDLSDTAFLSTPFKRTSVTNDKGQFWIRNIAPGEYHLFALQDQNRDYKFDQVGEAIAFYDDIIIPDFEPAVRIDTLWRDSVTIDTMKTVHYTRFLPDDIKLFLFNEVVENQYFVKSERVSDKQFTLEFGSNIGLPPQVKLLEENNEDWYVYEYSGDLKKITYWITDSLVYKQDTLKLEMNYLASDSLSNLVSKTDTLKLNLRKRNLPKAKDKKEEEKLKFLGIQINLQGSVDVTDTLKFTFPEPVMDFSSEKVLFQQKVDTLWVEQEVKILQDSLNPRIFYLDYRFPYEKEYQVTIDSAMIYGVYGEWNDRMNLTFKTKAEKDYGHLYVAIHDNDYNGFGQLLNASDQVVLESPLIDGELVFTDLKPGKYYLRYIDDENGNGKWDTGFYKENIQPEKVYYFEAAFDIKMYSETEHNWYIKTIPIEKQKPLDITKNKPVVKKQPNKDEERKKNSNTKENRTPQMSMPGNMF